MIYIENKKTIFTKWAAAISVAVSISAVGAQAAETAQQNSILEEIIVTAQKRSEGLQEMSTAASVYTGEARDIIGIETIQDLANLTPGMTVSDINGPIPKISIRGIGRLVSTLGNDSGVALYTDGFYSDGAQDLARSSLFVERTEILRGPQGTLYGRNSIGGAINVISARPTEEFTAELRTGFANFDRSQFEGMISGPLSDSVRYRLTGSHFDQQDGYYTNVSGGPDEGGRGRGTTFDGQLEWDVSDTLQLWLHVTHERNTFHHRDNVELAPYDLAPGGFLEDTNPTAYGYVGENPAIADNRDFRGDTESTTDTDLDRAIFRAEWSGDAFNVVYIGGYSDSKLSLINDGDGIDRAGFNYLTPLTLFTGMPVPEGTPGSLFTSTKIDQAVARDVTYYANEINFISNGPGPLQWIVGAYQYHESSSMPITRTPVNQPEVMNPCALELTALFQFNCLAPAAPNPSGYSFQLEADQETDSDGVFAQLDYDFSDVLRGKFGLRYTRDEKSGDEGLRFLLFNLDNNNTANFFGLGAFLPTAAVDLTAFSFGTTPGVTISPVTGVAERSPSDTWDGFSGTLGLEWAPSDEALYYFNFSRGFKSGGFNLGGIADPVDEESVNVYEFGMKQDFGDRIRLNGAVFLYDYQDLQTTLRVCLPPVCASTREVFVNLDEAKTWGLELESTFVITDRLNLLANYTYLNAKIGEQSSLFYNEAAELEMDIEGNDIPNSTPNKFSVTTLYGVDLFSGNLTLAATYVWRDATAYSIFENPGSTAKAFEQFDARATWTSADDRFRVIGFMQNILDKDGYTGANVGPAPRSSRTINLTPPRTYGAEFQVRF
tara:strand:+ start:5279 stop:7774 length:2496 start_codon:yes stop_codon:yes gene_type:complete